MIELEIEGAGIAAGGPSEARLQTALELVFASAGIGSGHVAVHYVDEDRSAELAREHLGKDDATDVISFPVDGADPIYAGDDDEALDAIAGGGPDELTRELGDIVICPVRTHDLLEAAVHGALHLAGMDHEVDDGEMLAVQGELMNWLREG